MAETVNSALAGTGRAMRITPRLRTRVVAAWRALRVDMSSVGQLLPSTARNTGSMPSLASKRACTCPADIDQPWSTRWQLLQLRPLVPRLWKNAVLVSIGPLFETVCSCPLALAVVMMPGAGMTVLGGCTRFEVEGEEPHAVAKTIEATANDDSNTRPVNFRRKLLLNHPPWRSYAGCRGICGF